MEVENQADVQAIHIRIEAAKQEINREKYTLQQLEASLLEWKKKKDQIKQEQRAEKEHNTQLRGEFERESSEIIKKYEAVVQMTQEDMDGEDESTSHYINDRRATQRIPLD
jgi:hypothetical protein